MRTHEALRRDHVRQSFFLAQRPAIVARHAEIDERIVFRTPLERMPSPIFAFRSVLKDVKLANLGANEFSGYSPHFFAMQADGASHGGSA